MLPIIITPENIKAVVIGNGGATQRRLAMLKDSNIKSFDYFSDTSQSFIDNLDNFIDFRKYNIALVADFDEETSQKIHKIIKKYNLLVNIEDKKHLCDFHTPAIIRRGDLLVTASTNGASPRLARNLKFMLEGIFPEKWSDNLRKICQKRLELREINKNFEFVGSETDKFLKEQKMTEDFCKKCQKNFFGKKN